MIGRLTLFSACLVLPLAAQAPPSSRDITADELRRRIEIISDDSMMGRDTPSPGLERAAAYVVREFRRLGLRPAGRRRHLRAALGDLPLGPGHGRLSGRARGRRGASQSPARR